MRLNRKIEKTTGPFAVAPKSGDEIVKLFRAHCEKTASPESFELLTFNAPQVGIGSEIVTKFDIPKNRRPNGKFIPCSFCGDAEKFLSGSLIWSEDGHLRIIGHICSRTEFGVANLREMQARYSRGISLEAASSFLIDHWTNAAHLLEEATRLATFAEPIDNYISNLRNHAPNLWGAIQSARKKQGALSIQRQTSSIGRQLGLRTSSGGTVDYEEVEVGRLIGTSLFGAKEKYGSSFMKIANRLREFSVSEDEVLTRLAARDEVQILNTRTAILESARSITSIRARLESGLTFFCEDNALAINKWANNANQTDRLKATLIGPTFRILEYGALPVDVNLAKLKELPEASTAWKILET